MLAVIFSARRRTGHIELEAVETLVRDSMHRAGASTLTRLLSTTGGHAPEAPCNCGQSARSHDTRPKQLRTVLGPVLIQRAYYVCSFATAGTVHWIGELDVGGTECSPGVRRMSGDRASADDATA